MLTSISIENFRCFGQFSLDTLQRVNLIAGKNNVGKTTLLEAIFLLGGGTNIAQLVINIATTRVQKVTGAATGELVFTPLFAKFSHQTSVKISGLLRSGKEATLELKMVPSTSIGLPLIDETSPTRERRHNPMPGQTLECHYTSPDDKSYLIQLKEADSSLRIEGEYLPLQQPFIVFLIVSSMLRPFEETAEQLGRLEVAKQHYDVLESLRIMEPRLKQIKTIYMAGMPLIYGDIGLERMIPLSLMGEGLGRLTSLLLTIADTPHGIVLIDEIDNGLHHSVLTKVWQAIGDAARRFDTQVIATTHSYECIQAAHQAFSKTESDDFRLHRLDRIGETIKAVTYDPETLEAALQAELEVR
ncbi:MAG TPA: ATPase [Cyanobacteria bacterium UBA11162]|nr:ATPase [Cyanobacteria bacterium UBA11162]